MFVNDDSKPDFNITWKDSNSKKANKSKVYAYGSDHLLAIAAFKLLRPSAHILKVDKISD